MPQKIRILHILSTVTGGGVERRRLSLTKYLDSSRFEMKLIGTRKEGFIADQIEENGMEIIEVGDFNGPFHWEKHKKVQKVIDEFKPHIIHGAVYEGVTMAAINGFLKKVPIIILEETSDPQNRSSKADFLLRVFSWTADKFIAIAPNVADYLRNRAKISEKKIITINNGVEIPRLVSEEEIGSLKKQLNISEVDFIIGSVGRLFNDHKKFTDIVEAIFYLSDYPQIKLMIVGSGPDEELIREKARSLDVESRVIFTGYQFDTAPFYQVMDVFCIASQREGFGLVAAEAMLHKLPVIATKVGGLQNVVVDHETGIMVEPNAPEVLSTAIRKLYENTVLCKQYANNGYKRAIENYTEKRYVQDIENLYLELLKKKNINV